MSKQRASMHNGKKSQKTGKVIRPPHNDTDREKNENVKKEWVKNNIYYNCYDGEYTPENQKGKMPFREAEIAYYNEYYKDALNAQNERHIKARQKNRVKSMEDWLDSPRYAPTESILRIGNVDDGFVCVEDLKKMTDCYIESLNDWSMNHGDCLHILNYAIHADEYYVDEDSGEEKPSSHHVHIRYVFDYIDEKGNKAIGICYVKHTAGSILLMQKLSVQQSIFWHFVQIEQNYLYQLQGRIDLSFFTDHFLNTFMHNTFF